MMTLPTGKQIQTTQTTKSNLLLKKLRNSGFTLIELIFVLVLMAVIGGFAMPKLASISGMNKKTKVLKLAGFLQRAHQLAVLKGKNFRVVLDANAGQFWIEEQQPPQTKELLPEEFKVDDVLMSFRKEAEDFMDEEQIEKRKQARFQKFEAQDVKKVSLPEGLTVASVYLSTQDENATEGLIYIPISHSGYHPPVIVHIAQGDEILFSLVFPALSAKASIEKGEAKPEEMQW
ncbi:MAG: type II secretion system protein [Bdellovibrionota bacterium]